MLGVKFLKVVRAKSRDAESVFSMKQLLVLIIWTVTSYNSYVVVGINMIPLDTESCHLTYSLVLWSTIEPFCR